MNGKRPHGLWFHLLDVLFNIVVIVSIVAVIRTVFIAPFQVDGSSMMDTLEDKEYIIINKLAYIVGKPERGDVVVFRPPNEEKKYYVKRVIGLPGDEVVIRGGNVFLKAAGSSELKKLDEPYLNEHNRGKTFRYPLNNGDLSEVRYKVPANDYFLLGDNRQGSLDSRSFTAKDGTAIPFVAGEEIKGRVWFVALPITRIHAIEPPQYGF